MTRIVAILLAIVFGVSLANVERADAATEPAPVLSSIDGPTTADAPAQPVETGPTWETGCNSWATPIAPDTHYVCWTSVPFLPVLDAPTDLVGIVDESYRGYNGKPTTSKVRYFADGTKDRITVWYPGNDLTVSRSTSSPRIKVLPLCPPGDVHISESGKASDPQCDPNGSNRLHIYMQKAKINGQTWRARCDHIGGMPDTYRKNGKTVRVCYVVDF